MRVLALDVGSSSARALAYDERGREVEGTLARRAYEPVYRSDGSAELDPDLLVTAAREALDEAAAALGGAADGVAISCFWHSLLLLDERRPLTSVLLWQDRRAAPQAERLAGRLDGAAIHARTGSVVHPSYWPAKLAWLVDERPDLLADARHAVSFAEYLFLQLTGELRMTLSSASGTGLLDVGTRAWDRELLDAIDLDPALLPPLSDDPAGAGPPLFPPLGDGACSNLGAGCTDAERAALMIGTSGAYRVLRRSDRPQARPGLFCYLLDEQRIVEGGAVSDGGNLHAWLERTLRLAHPHLDAPADPGLTFLPLLGGERSPGWNVHAAGAVAGLTFDTEPDDLYRAALAGVVYRLAEVASLLPEVREVVATGHALLASPEWIQLCADVLGRPVAASAVAEGSARGAAVYALERLGAEPEPAPDDQTYEPDPERTERHAAARERQRDLYDRLF
ncbi:MAG TPA: gluconokinase [Gaiellaceae bacterium]|jgi:gluconokinase|nr:gluconokinase [Gaiellaceae bacterium]